MEALRGVAGGAPVTYRLKRFETTVEKLRRLTSDLARLEDIGGCRVVVPTMREQRDILGLVRREFKIIRERDYQAEPRGGYRALHVVVHSQGKAVEVQLRTELEEQWANAVERLAERLDPEIKYGGGPPGINQLLDEVSTFFGNFDKTEERINRLREALSANPDNSESAKSAIGSLAQLHSALRTAREATSDLLRLIESAMIDESMHPEQLAALEPTIGRMREALDSAEDHLDAALVIAVGLDA